MKNINTLSKFLSAILAILMLACSMTLIGCTDSDPHAGHDHADEDEELQAAIDNMFPHVSLLTVSDNYPTVADYDISNVKKEKASSGPVVLRVAKIENGQYYCTAGNSLIANHILIDPPVELSLGDFLLVNTDAYTMSSERFGFDYGVTFSNMYVVFGQECELPEKITAEQAYQIYSTVPSVPVS